MNEIRYRVLRCAKELAAVPIEEVAKIAAMLVRNPASEAAKGGLAKKDGDDEKTATSEATTPKRVDEENPLVVATAEAFELLEIAYYGNFGLKETDSYEAGLAKFVEGRTIDEKFLDGIASSPKWQWQDAETAPFDKGLALLMPKPKRADREARFKAWLNDRCREAKPEQDDQERMIEVGENIAKMKTSGIPRNYSGKRALHSLTTGGIAG